MPTSNAKTDANAHWSASRFMLFEQCPRLYKERYVDGIASEPSLAMLFGSAIHTALEAMHQGHAGARPDRCAIEDRYKLGRLVYNEKFDEMAARLPEGIVAPASLYVEGLKMLDQVDQLNLNQDCHSEPERWFSIDASVANLNWPIVGAVDLWSPPWSKHGPTVWDFKTTVGGWGPDRVLKERWQPMLYTWAYRLAYDVIPTFMYVVLNRVDGTLELMQRTWSTREWNDDLSAMTFHAEEIAEAVAEGNFSCTRGHGTCLECGKPYGHDHVCAEGSRPNKVRLVRDRAGQAWVQPALALD